MSTITKELAKLFRKITNSEIDAEGNAHVVLSPADSLLINNARIALASLEVEAVAYMHHSGQVVTREECCDDKIFAICCKVETPLYAAPQLPQPAPEALKRLRSIVADPKTLPCRKEWISGQQYSYVLLESVEAMVDDYRERIAILESRKVCVPRISNDEFWLSFNNRIVFREETYRSAVIKSIEAAGIGVKGE